MPPEVARRGDIREYLAVSTRGRLLVLWNQVEEDVYERWREEGPRTLPWDPNKVAPDVGTVQEEMDALVGGLRDARFRVDVVNVEDDLDRMFSAIRFYRPDAVFNLVEYFRDDPAQEAYVAGLFEMMGVSYTGNRPITLATCQNKYRTKLLLEAAGLPTAEFFLASRSPVPADHGLEFPLIVKPAFEDASGGIEPDSVVMDHDALAARVAHVLSEFGTPALVEEYIEGREIHAAILGNSPPEVLPLFEMEFDAAADDSDWRPQIISFRAKWDPYHKDFYSMDAVVPPRDLDPVVEGYIRDVAVSAFQAVRGRDYARIDMRVDPEGQPFILEVNPNPDLVDGAAYAMCARAGGRSYPETVAAIGDLAVARSRRLPRPGDAASLPSDQLLREHILDRREPTGGGRGDP
jgi:D-alanine-D-alanine ligase